MEPTDKTVSAEPTAIGANEDTLLWRAIDRLDVAVDAVAATLANVSARLAAIEKGC